MANYQLFAGSNITLLEHISHILKFWQDGVNSKIEGGPHLNRDYDPLWRDYEGGFFFSLRVKMELERKGYDPIKAVFSPKILTAGNVTLWVGFDYYIDVGVEREYKYNKLGRFPNTLTEIEWEMLASNHVKWQYNWHRRIVSELSTFYEKFLPLKLHDSPERINAVTFTFDPTSFGMQELGTPVLVHHDKKPDHHFNRQVIDVVDPFQKSPVIPPVLEKTGFTDIQTQDLKLVK